MRRIKNVICFLEWAPDLDHAWQGLLHWAAAELSFSFSQAVRQTDSLFLSVHVLEDIESIGRKRCLMRPPWPHLPVPL